VTDETLNIKLTYGEARSLCFAWAGDHEAIDSVETHEAMRKINAVVDEAENRQVGDDDLYREAHAPERTRRDG
jgi:hypothetical protein